MTVYIEVIKRRGWCFICNRILKDGGLLVVNYPDISSWIARLMGRKWVFLLSVYLYYFTPKTIEKTLECCGFEILKKNLIFKNFI